MDTKGFDKCLAVLNVLSATKLNVWYLNSECFYHMTRDKDVFLSLNPFIGGGIVFDSGIVFK